MNLSTRIKEAEERFDKIGKKSGLYDACVDVDMIRNLLSQELQSLAEDMAKEIVPKERNSFSALASSQYYEAGFNACLDIIKQRLENYLK